MASDKLYGLAFEYKKTRLWEKLYDDEIFAVKLPDGETGYISIMGLAGDYIAIGLYVGREGFNSYRIIADTYDDDFESYLLYQEYLLKQECLQCTFQDKSELSEEEAAEIKDYADRNNISLKGDSPYPQFVKYKAGYCPWAIQEEKDKQYIEEALKASTAIAGMLKENSMQDIGIKRLDECDGRNIILLEPGENGYKISYTELPEPLPEKYIIPGTFNDINVAKLKNMKKKGVWECELVQYPEPVRNEPEEVPYFPMMFLAVELDTDFILPVTPVGHFNESPDKLLDIVVEAFLMQNICPKLIYVRDKRSYYFLEGLCKKLKTKLVIKTGLYALDSAEEELAGYLCDDGSGEDMPDITSLFGDIAKLSDEELKSLPDIIVNQFAVLFNKNIMTEELAARLDEVFNFTGDNDITDKKADNIIPIGNCQSYVISVSCYKGCYRHIQISADNTLFELHNTILDAFGFDDDHAHAFFMDNLRHGSNEAYYVDWIEGKRLYTNCYTLRETGMEKGKQFKYLFDFGGNWLFQCKVLRVLNENTDVPFIVKSVGESPEQYPDFED